MEPPTRHRFQAPPVAALRAAIPGVVVGVIAAVVAVGLSYGNETAFGVALLVAVGLPVFGGIRALLLWLHAGRNGFGLDEEQISLYRGQRAAHAFAWADVSVVEFRWASADPVWGNFYPDLPMVRVMPRSGRPRQWDVLARPGDVDLAVMRRIAARQGIDFRE